MTTEPVNEEPRSPKPPLNRPRPASVGPRIPRSLLFFVVLFVLILISLRVMVNGEYETISYAQFRSQWNESTKRFEGYLEAKLRDDVIEVRTEVFEEKAKKAKEEAEKAKLASDGKSDKSAEKPAPTDNAANKTTPPAQQPNVADKNAPPKTDATKIEPAKSDADKAALVKGDKGTSTALPTDPQGVDLKTGKKLGEWYKVKVPATALQDGLLKELATIPGFMYEPSNKAITTVLLPLITLAMFLLLFYFLFIRPFRIQGGPGNVLSFGRSKPRIVGKDQSPVRFSDVAGIDEAKEEVTEVIEFLKNPQKFEKLGGRIPRGLIFVGPPGTGKTLLAKAIAGEAEVPFYSICGSDFVEMFVGVGASRVRDLFRQAKETAPCIIFLDEVDAVGRRRGSGLGGGHDEREQTLNAILVEMDGFDTNEQVVVIASTNRPDVLDPALLRPGRFDREVVISLPDVKGRHEILKVHARKIKLRDDVELDKIARGTPMYSGAELEAIINEAAIIATMQNKDFVDQSDLEEARDKVRFGRQKKSREVDEMDRKLAALHEAGHAIVLIESQDAEPLHKVTIIPRGMMGGATMWLPEKDRTHMTKRRLLTHIRVAFGGRIAEQMFLDDISSGAIGDIQSATGIARQMVCDYGMSDELGPIHYSNKEQHVFLGGEMSVPREHSEATAEKIDLAVRRIVDQCYQEAEEIVRSKAHETHLIADALLKFETLTAAEVEKILRTKDINSIEKEVPPGAPKLMTEPVAASA